MVLATYRTQVADLLNDPNNQTYSVALIDRCINQARHQIAAEGQCIRYLVPSSGYVASITVSAAGSGYLTPPTVAISASDGIVVPGVNATATSSVSGGAVTGFTMAVTGAGYFNQPTVTLSGGSGSGAAGTAVLSYFNATVAGQEVYPFAAINCSGFTPSGSVAATGAVLAVRTIGMVWGTFEFVLQRYSWSRYQAYARNYLAGMQDIPAVSTQYGLGLAGSIAMYPLPSQAYPMQWDALLDPADLADDTTPEAIPYPWTTCVQFLASYWALMGKQRYKDAEGMFGQYVMWAKRARSNSMPGATVNFYGRG